MANSSDALVASSPIGRSLRTITSSGSSVVPESETSSVSLERPPGTTSSRVTRRSGESGKRPRKYVVSSSAVTEHAAGEAEASGLSSSRKHGLSQLVDPLEEAPLDVDQRTALRPLAGVRAPRLCRNDVRRLPS